MHTLQMLVGLSRKNKITTKLVVLFLDKMRYSNDFNAYQSTLSITGVRGTLAKRFVNSDLSGKFFGKTGTLSNVFALSGFLYKNDQPIIITVSYTHLTLPTTVDV